ncbi:MAG TPA: glycosyltransferase [Mycobacteriales bacterium]|jgi:GT2 family glycosyltransferase
MPPRVRLAHPHHRVTAVVVAHDGARWLPDVLAALQAQARVAQRVVGVDTGSEDGSGDLLRAALGEANVLTLARDTGYAAAVAAGVAHADAVAPFGPLPRRRGSDAETPSEPVEWVWLLHDDSAPEADALARLVDAAEEMPSVAVFGPKARDWDDPRLLVEVGVTIDRAGRRETGLERREFDQGQHDAVRDVLAVGSAGALVRRRAWDELGGYDVRLPLFRDDVDFGWRAAAAGHRVVVLPAARVRHARAATLGRRRLDATHGSAHGVDRRHALFVLLANLPALNAVAAAPRLLLGAVLRTVGFLLTRQVGAARDEVAAVAWNVTHIPELLRARRARKATRRAPWAAVRTLFAGRTARLRGYFEQFADWATGGGGETAFDENDEEAEEPRRRSVGAALLARPGLALFLSLTALTLLAARHLLGGGSLVGGALLPVPEGASDLARTYGASWRDSVGAGSASPATPAVAVLAGLASVFLGKPWLALDVLLLGCVPLAGVSAYLSAGRVTASLPLKLWAGVAYALVPVATGAIATGHLDAAVALVAAPPLLLAGHRLLAEDPRYGGWRRPFATGVGLALATAFAPQLWLLAALPLAAGALVVLLSATPASRAGAVRRIAAVALALATALAVLFPWSLRLLTTPRLLLGGTAPDGVPSASDLLLLRPGNAAVPAAVATAGLVLAALAALVRERRAAGALSCWAVALVAYGLAYVTARGTGGLDRGYAGVPLAVAAAALAGAGILAADGSRERLAARSFGWRQPAAALVALLAAVGPLVAAGAWVARGAQDPLDRRVPAALPAAALSQLERDPGTRVLWLRPRADGSVGYVLSSPRGPGFGDAELPRTPVTMRALDRIVGDLAVPRGSDAAEALATFGVKFVAVPDPVPAFVAAGLDAQAGLARVNFQGDVRVWRTLTPAARLTVLPPSAAAPAREGRVASRDQLRLDPPLAVRDGRAVPGGQPGRVLALAQRAHPGWEATLDGRPLKRVTLYGWAQGFELPEAGGTVRVRHDGSSRTASLAVQGVLLLVALVLAAPPVRRGDDEPEPEPEEAEEEPVLAGTGNVRTVS